MALPIPTKDALTGETVMLKLRRFWRYFVDWVESANPIIEGVEDFGTQITAIESRVDSQDSRITQNTSDITQNANAIAVNSEQIQENILDITENADNIQSIEDELTVITPKVNKAVTDITNLDGEIADTNAHLNTVEGELDSHIANRNNPHGVTKEQLGLTAVMQPYGSVETYADLPADAPAGATYNVRQAYGDYPPNTNFTKTVSGEWDSMGGEVDFQPVYDSINDVATDLSAHITQSNTRFANLDTKNTQQDTAIDNLDTNKQKKIIFGAGLDYNETTGELDVNGFVGEVDSTLSTTSEHPVQNKVITEALNRKQPTGDYATATQLENLGSTVSDQGTQLSGLATTVQGLQTTIAGVDTKANENANDIASLETSKQNKLTFDTTPTSGSNNPVTSGGIYTELQKFANIEQWEELSINNLPNDFQAGDVLKIRIALPDGSITGPTSWTSTIESGDGLVINANRISGYRDITVTLATEASRISIMTLGWTHFVTGCNFIVYPLLSLNSGALGGYERYTFNRSGCVKEDALGLSSLSSTDKLKMIPKIWRLVQ